MRYQPQPVPGLVGRTVRGLAAVLLTPLVVLLAVVARFWPKRIDVGLGPEPHINALHHKQALLRAGYSAETCVNQVWYFADDFDVRGDRFWGARTPGLRWLVAVRLWFVTARRYRCMYLSFNGSPLAITPLWRAMDPWLYRLAGVRTVILPYGSDVQDFSRSRNLSLKNAMSEDYPEYRLVRQRVSRQIDRWTCGADHIVSGVDWVDYMYHWDTLLVGHFAIGTEQWRPQVESGNWVPGATPQLSDVKFSGALPQAPITALNNAESMQQPIRVLHAPNHRALKGTRHFEAAVEELRAEGLNVELSVVQGVSNLELRERIRQADIVADQLVIGWYAMLAIEAMALGKPVLCYLRPDLVELHVNSGALQPGEPPLVDCSPQTVKEQLRRLMLDAKERREVGARARAYVVAHHSLEAIGRVFDRINRQLGIKPHNLAPSDSLSAPESRPPAPRL
ncbi:MAG: hypothetical protein K8T25_15970 [Planctomycetia bacterium]|nr:hypothetical protein [Planctomycetia bacterium]